MGNEFILGPKKIVDALAAEVKAKYDEANDIYVISCELKPADIALTIGINQYFISHNNYITQVPYLFWFQQNKRNTFRKIQMVNVFSHSESINQAMDLIGSLEILLCAPIAIRMTWATNKSASPKPKQRSEKNIQKFFTIHSLLFCIEALSPDDSIWCSLF